MPVVRELTVCDFRTYKRACLRLAEPGLHVLWGGNGEGKTSLLEALHVAALLRSFRTGMIPDLVREGADSFEVAVTLGEVGETDGQRLYVRMGKDKALRRNGREIRRASEFINGFVCIALVPEDVELIAGAPARRRQFMDMLLSQLDDRHMAHLSGYREALRQRNALFRRQGDPDRHAAAAFGAVMARHGVGILRARQVLCTQINEALSARRADLLRTATSDLTVSVEYRTSSRVQPADAETGEQELKAEIERHWDRDVRQGCTTTGPHRDDLAVSFNGRAVTKYGSQGERRLSGIVLKLASLQLVNQVFQGRKPILLLIDDVLGDLDAGRRQAFLQSVSGADQVLLVQTEPPDAGTLPCEPAAIHHVADGQVTSQL